MMTKEKSFAQLEEMFNLGGTIKENYPPKGIRNISNTKQLAYLVARKWMLQQLPKSGEIEKNNMTALAGALMMGDLTESDADNLSKEYEHIKYGFEWLENKERELNNA